MSVQNVRDVYRDPLSKESVKSFTGSWPSIDRQSEEGPRPHHVSEGLTNAHARNFFPDCVGTALLFGHRGIRALAVFR